MPKSGFWKQKMFLATFDNLEHASFELPLEKAAFAPEPPIVSGVLSPRVRLFKKLILIVRFDCSGSTNQSVAKTTKSWGERCDGKT